MTIQEVDRQIADLEALERQQIQELDAATKDLENWQRALAIDRANNATMQTIVWSLQNIDRATKRLKDAQDALKPTQDKLKTLRERRDRIEQAAATAISNGLSPDKAYEEAARKAEQEAQTKRFLTIAAVVLVILAIIIFLWRRYRK